MLPALKIEFACEGGLWLQIVDDAEDALMPLYEAGIEQIEARFDVHLREADEIVSIHAAPVDAPEYTYTLSSGTAVIGCSVQASHFNNSNGYWEPVVEPWQIAGYWQMMMRRGDEDEEAGASSSRTSVNKDATAENVDAALGGGAEQTVICTRARPMQNLTLQASALTPSLKPLSSSSQPQASASASISAPIPMPAFYCISDHLIFLPL